MASLLVLWDVDYTLADSDGAGRYLYRLAFTEMFGAGRPLPESVSMAGRTDRAIVLELLAKAGIPDPGRHVRRFEALLTAHATEAAHLVREHGRALPGAARAMAALASLDAASQNAASQDGASPAGASPTGASQDAATLDDADQAGDDRAGTGRRCLVQSLLTGNVRAVAEVKLGTLGLTEHLDLSVGAYGDASEVRADLVHLARANAAAAYQRDFGGQATVLVGDTPLDVEAALHTGARAVAVATGRFTLAELTAAGAHAVLPDLADTDRVLAAILGPSQPP